MVQLAHTDHWQTLLNSGNVITEIRYYIKLDPYDNIGITSINATNAKTLVYIAFLWHGANSVFDSLVESVNTKDERMKHFI